MKNVLKNYGFIIMMLTGIVAGCVVGAVWPGATVLEPLGTIFINLMFCIVVPMVFCSIASAIANMDSIHVFFRPGHGHVQPGDHSQGRQLLPLVGELQQRPAVAFRQSCGPEGIQHLR